MICAVFHCKPVRIQTASLCLLRITYTHSSTKCLLGNYLYAGWLLKTSFLKKKKKKKVPYSRAEQNSSSVYKFISPHLFWDLLALRIQDTAITPTDEARDCMKESIQTLLTQHLLCMLHEGGMERARKKIREKQLRTRFVTNPTLKDTSTTALGQPCKLTSHVQFRSK